jgi:zinc protease
MVTLALSLLLLSLSIAASPQIQHWQTDNGARVYYVPAPELPLLDIRVVFDAGAARDGDHPGLALLTNSLLSEGAAGRDADAISEAFDRVGARFSSSSQRDMATLSLRSLTDPALLEPALENFSLLLHRPSFPNDALERLRQQMLTSLQHQQQRPDEIASLAFYRSLYGEHPYASPSSGTEASVRQLKRPQLSDFYQRYYVANNATIALVGAIDRQQAEAIAERLSGGLASGQAASPLPPAAALQEGKVERIEHNSSQTHILMGQPGVYRGDPDYFPLYLGNHILGGGGLVSRISEEVREKRGLAYSASSYFLPMRQAGPYTLSLQTRNDNAQLALDVLQETLREFVAKGPSETELEAAKKNLIGGFALNTDSNSKILGYIAMIGFYQLPLDYLDSFIGKIEAIDSEQIREAFRRRIDPERMAIILVGGQ